MTDPLDALRIPHTPVAPDPAFARALRARLERALLAPLKEDTMTTTEATTTGVHPGDVIYAALWIPDVTAAERFYAAVLGWNVVPGGDPRGRQVTGLSIPFGLWTEPSRPGLFLCFAVADVDETVQAVQAAGGTASEPRDEPYGRIADCRDDQGLRFAICTPSPDHATGPAGVGDIGYYELRMPDATRARAFYGTVLGWRFLPGNQPGYWHGEPGAGARLPVNGVVGGHDRATAVPWFRVTDLDAAVAAVRAAGGRAEEPTMASYGRTVTCADDQGLVFHLAQQD